MPVIPRGSFEASDEMMKIPFVDLKEQYRLLKQEIDQAIQSVIADTAFVGGKYVTEFERVYSEKYGVKHCIGVGNGTDAIYLTLKSLGIGAGDEVMTAANSWISTSETISQTGAKPVFVDIEPDYYTIDTAKIEEKMTPRTKVILPVHLYGQPADMGAIKKIATRHGLQIVEDCAQAHFSEYEGRKVGTFGIAGTFSFYPGKNLGAYGDGGAVITNDDQLARKIRMFANHGSLKKHEHETEGVNSRLDGLQAAILSVKLAHIDGWNRKRYENGMLYNRLLSEVREVSIPKIRPGVKHIFHVYAVRTAKREALQQFLNSKGIRTNIHYPTALPFLPAYRYLKHSPRDFPIAYRYQNELLSLPLYPELSRDTIIFVTEQIKSFFSV